MILYIHIPFCTSRCGYCTFNTFDNKASLQDFFIQALLQDLIFSSTKEPLQSIFFGGGTPNTLSIHAYEKIFATIKKHYCYASDCEITMEANPNLLSKQWCQDIKSLGVNRLSIGVQSFFDDKLLFLQREHCYEDIFCAIDDAYEAGIQNLSIDLIYDTPLDHHKRIQKEIAFAAQLPINHLSAYSLSIEKDSKLQQQGITPASYSFFQEVKEALLHHNFLQYEVSNYARPYRVKHNLAYWNDEDYIGCGCGAVGKIKDKRLYPHKKLENYIQDPIFRNIEELSLQERNFEKIFLGLRCDLGVQAQLLNPKKLQILLDHQKVFLQKDRVFAYDYFLADELCLWLS